nr:hypothetical protein Itr_chr12CG01010 [Ipomoea trifida]
MKGPTKNGDWRVVAASQQHYWTRLDFHSLSFNNLFQFVLSLSRKFLKIVPFCFSALHRKLQFWCFLLGFPVADHYTIFPSPFLQF